MFCLFSSCCVVSRNVLVCFICCVLVCISVRCVNGGNLVVWCWFNLVCVNGW